MFDLQAVLRDPSLLDDSTQNDLLELARIVLGRLGSDGVEDLVGQLDETAVDELKAGLEVYGHAC